MASEKPLPFAYQFAAGAVAGVSEILVMYPLDVVKTRMHVNTLLGLAMTVSDASRQSASDKIRSGRRGVQWHDGLFPESDQDRRVNIT